MAVSTYCYEKRLDYAFDPSCLLESLPEGASYRCLLESAEPSKNQSQTSILGLSAALTVKGYSDHVIIQSCNKNGAQLIDALVDQGIFNCDADNSGSTVLPRLKVSYAKVKTDVDQLPLSSIISRLFAAIDCANVSDKSKIYLVGSFSYELAQLAEPRPGYHDLASTPLVELALLDKLALVQHKQASSRLIEIVFAKGEQQYFAGFEQLEKQIEAQRFAQPNKLVASTTLDTVAMTFESNQSDQEFADTVVRCKQHIAHGDVFQIVPSRQFYSRCEQPLRAYQYLKQQNPGPYLFYLEQADRSIFGSSPESALSYQASSNRVSLMPIAGTRKRRYLPCGELDQSEDTLAEVDLRLDEKELAEHLMLVDLARNDLAKICQQGTRYVSQLMEVVKYSQVMHLVSEVSGQLASGLTALDAYLATANMGTLVGAPKIEAATILNKLEATPRDIFGGAIGYLTAAGDMDCAIAIRTAVVDKQANACVQAGAGVVFDSQPEMEAQETKSKASAVLKAILCAQVANEPTTSREVCAS